jgi:hypothetical protein
MTGAAARRFGLHKQIYPAYKKNFPDVLHLRNEFAINYQVSSRPANPSPVL